jgi:hypothetical protein
MTVGNGIKAAVKAFFQAKREMDVERNLGASVYAIGDHFITTHSSVFIADNHSDQTVFKVEKIERHTTFDAIDKFAKQQEG